MELDSASRLAIWNTLTTESFVADSFGDLLLISDGTNGRSVKVTGANHIAADVHEVQPDGLAASDDVADLLLWTHRIAATTAGKASGAGSSTETFLIDGLVQVVVSLDVNNNRTNVQYDEL